MKVVQKSHVPGYERIERLDLNVLFQGRSALQRTADICINTHAHIAYPLWKTFHIEMAWYILAHKNFYVWSYESGQEIRNHHNLNTMIAAVDTGSLNNSRNIHPSLNHIPKTKQLLAWSTHGAVLYRQLLRLRCLTYSLNKRLQAQNKLHQYLPSHHFRLSGPWQVLVI